LWKDHETFAQEIRKVDHLSLEKTDVQKIMEEITGETQGGKSEGRIYLSLVETHNIKDNLEYFGFYRLLSKMCHLTMT